jgi:hypothetical protein
MKIIINFEKIIICILGLMYVSNGGKLTKYSIKITHYYKELFLDKIINETPADYSPHLWLFTETISPNCLNCECTESSFNNFMNKNLIFGRGIEF